jgi:hypothetical protein
MFTLDRVVPWGRSFEEYRHMFALGPDDFAAPVLGCGDGPASFNAEASRLGARVISCDPIYRWDAGHIRDRIAATSEEVLSETRRNAHEFVWDSIRSVEELAQIRKEAMEQFLADFSGHQRGRRYVAAELPRLPFRGAAFHLALCSHLLFLYSNQLGEAFHHAAVHELCRAAREVRIFPLVALGGQRSPYIHSTVDTLRKAGHQVSIEKVPYEFQRGGDEMMRIRT